MSSRKRGELTPLGRIITESVNEGFLGLAKELVRIYQVWPEAVGEYNNSKTKPESMRNGILTVLVESSVWIDRFNYLKPMFRSSINEAIGGELVEEIIFKVGRLDDRRGATTKTAKTNKLEETSAPPSPEAIERAVECIEDPELKMRLAALFARQRPDRK